MSPSSPPEREWFDAPGAAGDAGLRFACTMCGNCCTGPEGYVLFTDEEADRLARRLGVGRDEFLRRYTRWTIKGRSLGEVPSAHGLDCVFLDRHSVPGKAVCSVYEDRPAQCRAWPFWPSVLASRESWALAARRCPGMGRGDVVPVERVRVLRDSVRV